MDDHHGRARNCALEIPEIVSLIHDAIQQIHFRTLLSCSLVNRRWHHEAVKRIWRSCVDSSYFSDPPEPWQLILLDKDVQYDLAVHTKKLEVTCPDGLEEDAPRGFSKWTIPALSYLNWPALQDLSFELPHERDGWQSNLSSLVTSNLRSFHVVIGSVYSMALPESLIADLVRKSSKLIEFRLRCTAFTQHMPTSIVSSSAANSFINSVQSLKHFEWASDQGISQEVFTALARKESLESLRLQYVGLFRGSIWPGEFSINLTCLSTSMSSGTLRHVLPKFRGLKSFAIVAISEINETIQAISSTVSGRILQLRIEPQRGQRIMGSTLLAFVKNSKQLQVLDLINTGRFERCSDIWHRTSLDEWNDHSMEQLAAALPDLRELHLPGDDRTTLLTQKSLLSLGRHCSELTTCHLSARIDCDDLLLEAGPKYWKRLVFLTVHKPRYSVYGNHAGGVNALQARMKRMKEAMPSLLFEHQLKDILLD